MSVFERERKAGRQQKVVRRRSVEVTEMEALTRSIVSRVEIWERVRDILEFVVGDGGGLMGIS